MNKLRPGLHVMDPPIPSRIMDTDHGDLSNPQMRKTLLSATTLFSYLNNSIGFSQDSPANTQQLFQTPAHRRKLWSSGPWHFEVCAFTPHLLLAGQLHFGRPKTSKFTSILGDPNNMF